MLLTYGTSICGALAVWLVTLTGAAGQSGFPLIGEEMSERVAALDSYTVSSEIGVQVSPSESVIVKFTMAFDNTGYCASRRESPDGRFRVTIKNPSYYSVISSADGNIWEIQYVEESNDFTEEQIQSVNTFHAQVLDPFTLQTLVDLEHSAIGLSEGVAGWDGARYKFVEIELPGNAEAALGLPGSHFAKAKIRYYWSEENPQLLAKAEMLSPVANSADVIGTSLVYRQYKKHGDFEFPTEVDAGSISSFGGKVSNKKTYRYGYSNVFEPIDRKICFLSFYGLPEPGSLAISRWLVLLGVLAVVAMVAVYLRRRGQR